MRQDLISRCELFNRLATVQTLGEAYAVIQDMPTVERKTGKWIEYDNSHCECPFCHTEWSYFDNEVEHFDFCPRCGAKMEAET